MKTFTLFFIVIVCTVALATCRNSGSTDDAIGDIEGQISRLKRDTGDFQKEMEERIEKLKENAQAVKERLMEEYEKLKKMMAGGIESVQEKASSLGNDDHE